MRLKKETKKMNCPKCEEKEKMVENGLYLHIAHCKNGHAWIDDPNRIIPEIKLYVEKLYK